MLAELLCHPFGVPALAECPDRRGDGLAHLLGAEPLIALQRDTNKPSARTSEPPADRVVEGVVVPPGEPEEAAPVPVSSRWRKRVAEPTLGCALVPAAGRPCDMCQFEDRRTQRGWRPTARYEAELRAAERHDALLCGNCLRQLAAQGVVIHSRKLPDVNPPRRGEIRRSAGSRPAVSGLRAWYGHCGRDHAFSPDLRCKASRGNGVSDPAARSRELSPNRTLEALSSRFYG